MHHPTDRIAHTTVFVTPVVEREIAQWVHPMKDRSDDPSHHERTLLPRSYTSLPTVRATLTTSWRTLRQLHRLVVGVDQHERRLPVDRHLVEKQHLRNACRVDGRRHRRGLLLLPHLLRLDDAAAVHHGRSLAAGNHLDVGGVGQHLRASLGGRVRLDLAVRHLLGTRHRCRKEGRKEMFYLTTHSTHFIYGYMVSDIW